MNIQNTITLAVVACSLLTLAGCPTSTVKIENDSVYHEVAGNETTRDTQPAQLPAPQVAAAEPAPTDVAQAVAVKEEPQNDEPKKEESPKPASDANPAIRPKADRTPRKPGEPLKITFDNIILGMQANMVYRPWMLKDEVKDLEGQRVSITGVMYPGDSSKFDSFILLRNKECKYGDGGQADHLADIKLKPGTKTTYHGGTVRVEGVLKVAPDTRDDFTWSVYVIDDAKVTVQQ